MSLLLPPKLVEERSSSKKTQLFSGSFTSRVCSRSTLGKFGGLSCCFWFLGEISERSRVSARQASPEMDCGEGGQLPANLLDLNWDQTMVPSGDFDPSLSPIVAPPPSSRDSGDKKLPMLDQKGGVPLNFSAKIDLSAFHQRQIPPTYLDQINSDACFAERAARFSIFDGRNNSSLAARQLGLVDAEKLMKAASGDPFQIGLQGCRKEIVVPGGLKLDINNGEFVSDPANQEAISVKKRKVPPKGKGKGNRLDISAMDHSKVKELYQSQLLFLCGKQMTVKLLLLFLR